MTLSLNKSVKSWRYITTEKFKVNANMAIINLGFSAF